MNYTIEDLRRGRCAVVNDSTPEKLKEILIKAFPEHKQVKDWGCIHRYYFRGDLNKKYCGCDDTTDLPKQSVKDFLEPALPNKGDVILVSNVKDQDHTYVRRFFVAFVSESLNPIIACTEKDTLEKSVKDKILSGEPVATYSWKYWKPISQELPKVEMTLQEIADLKGIKLEQLLIKDK